IGARTKATVVKNKVAPPFKKCEFDILFAEGINRLGELLDIGVESAFLKRSGTWISYGETRLGQGREKARDFLKENPALAKEIEEGLFAQLVKRQVAAGFGPLGSLGASGSSAGSSSVGGAAVVADGDGDDDGEAKPAVRPEVGRSGRGSAPQRPQAGGGSKPMVAE
ncbi:MAG: DNA recombination/repair protein RecA, partial [Planctomycetes bacterium]|nr:DNA recombination/repair protein RecA [Planctomycetota bacterium]